MWLGEEVLVRSLIQAVGYKLPSTTIKQVVERHLGTRTVELTTVQKSQCRARGVSLSHTGEMHVAGLEWVHSMPEPRYLRIREALAQFRELHPVKASRAVVNDRLIAVVGRLEAKIDAQNRTIDRLARRLAAHESWVREVWGE